MSDSKKPKKIMRFLLVGSLALNILLIGLFVGASLTGRNGPPRGFDLQLGPISQMLPREDRRKIGAEIRKAMRGMQSSGRTRQLAVAEILDALAADPFDAEAFTQKIREQQSAQDSIRMVALNAFVDHVAALPVADRAALAERFRNEMKRGRERGPRPPRDENNGE